MRALLILLVVLVPIADLVLIVLLVPYLGAHLLLAWTAVTLLVGLTIARLAGANALHNLRAELAAGRMPGRQTLDDGLHVLGGLLLAFPGFITDLLAFPLLLRSTRRLITVILIAVLRKRLGLPELDPDRPVYTIGPDGRPIRDIDVEIHDEPNPPPHDQLKS